MVPTRLALRRFLCYRDPVEVDFTGLHLACLSGENGAGKSALLDAMTWALWEKARADNQHLVSLGESETRVEFSFRLDGTEYRVVRGFTAGGRGRSLLELHLRNGDEWLPIATGSKTAVQREIDRLLGISYTTFVNSVFLLQGKADEFARRTPSERKKILAELLELDRYERYRELAREEGRRLREHRLGLEREVEILNERAAAIPALRTRLSTIEATAQARQEELRRQQEHALVLQERVQRLALEIERYREWRARAQACDEERRALLQQLEDLAAEAARHQAVLAREDEIRARAAERQRLQQALQEIARITSRRQQLNEAIRLLQAEREERLRWFQVEIRTRQERLQQHRQTIAQRPLLEQQRARSQADLARMEALRSELDALDRQLATLREQDADLRTALHVRAAYEARLRELSAQVRSLEAQRERRAQELSHRRALEQERVSLVREWARLEELRAEEQALAEQLASLRERNIALTTSGKQLRQRLEELQEQRAQLEAIDAVCPVCLRPLSPEERTRQCAELDSAIHQVRSEFEELGREARAIREQITFLEQRKQECAAQRSDEHRIQTRLGSLASELERLARVEQEIVDLDRQLRELRAAERTDPQLRELEQRLRELEQRLAGRRTVRLAPHPQELSELFLMHEREAQAVQEQMAALERRRSELSAQLCEESRIRAELARIVTELDRLAALEQEVGTLERELEELRRSERTDPHLLALQRQLEEHEHELRSLPYDEGQHRAIERRLAELDSVPDELHALEQARFALAFTRERIVHLEQRRAQIEEELATLQAALNAKAPPEAEYTAAQRELAEARQVLARLEAAVQAVQAELGAVRQQLRDAEAAAEEASVLSQQIERLTREQAVLEELERAFGKNGIQTLILENVLPDLAETANEILDRLPGNTLRVDFATQRERASGDGAIETLEILISDEFGQRPYELYSGGEAFRINFALRVALSLLLAQRAGRRLETLVIDEGFGTQDAKGREGLVQALQAVSDRFALILVVTHLEELKDQFPQRIEVTKTPTGSQVFVLS